MPLLTSKNIISAILDHGADINAINKNNATALLLTCKNGNKHAINVLLNFGANPNIAAANGDTCLHYAARNDCCTEVLHAIISYDVDVNATNKKNVTALMRACQKGNTDAINMLLSAGADPNITDSKGATCIQSAVDGGCSKGVLETVLNHGADINITNKNNITTIMIACEKGNIDSSKCTFQCWS